MCIRDRSPFNPESMAIEAGRLMLQRINELLKNQQNFSIETTLATRSYTLLGHRAQEQVYKVNLIYFWLSSPDLAIPVSYTHLDVYKRQDPSSEDPANLKYRAIALGFRGYAYLQLTYLYQHSYYLSLIHI